MSLKNPRVTVLMPVYNGEKYLRQAMDSILNQTFTDFEFLIINDGSKDGSVEIIEAYDDPRIRLVHNEQNLKLVATLNKGIDLARGEYIARMDCDDISLPERLARQVAVMDKYPDVGVCGAWAWVIDSAGKVFDKIKTPVGRKLASFYWRPSPFVHPTVMIRSAILKQNKYDQRFADAEDYALWLSLCRVTGFYNLAEFLLLYRVHPASVTSTNRIIQLQNSYNAFKEFYGADMISYEVFISFFLTNKVNPLHRAYYLCKLAGKRKISFLDVWIDSLKYFIKYCLALLKPGEKG